MVNVNKNIVPGKKAESSAKTEPQAPARRPRNQELNSSKKLPDSIKNRRKQKLNCSREQVIDQLVNEEQIYTQEEAEELVNAFEEQTGATVERLATVEEVEEQDGEFWATKDGRTTLWCRGNGMWYDSGISDEGDALDSSCGENLDSSAEGTAEGEGDQSLNSSEGEGEGDEGFAEEPAGDADGGESVGEGANLDDIKITTESGNEVSMQDIKIVQNPDTNELAIFIPEDEEETIPEGFTVIGMVVPDAVGSTPAIEGGDVCPECGQDPCVCEGADDEELDSSKKKNPKVASARLNSSRWDWDDWNDYAEQIPVSPQITEAVAQYAGYEGELEIEKVLKPIGDVGGYLKRAGIEALIFVYDPTDREGYEEILGWTGSDIDDSSAFNLADIQNRAFDGGFGIDSSSMNCSLGGGDDRQDATSQVTVPKSFPDDKVHDLYRWVESELQNEGIDVDVYGVGRPSASTISFEFEVTGRDPSEVDAIIEDRVKEFIANGNNAIQYPEGDPRNGLNSGKHEKSLNCKVENARVEPTEQGTWVVKADTDRFGKDAILYEHYSEEGANKYLDRLKAGGDAVANGYDGHIDPKKVDLDSGDGTAEAKLDKASISKAMSKVLLEDKDTPLVYLHLKDGIKVYIQTAGYEDNQLVADGNFDAAKIYVAMYDKNYKPIMVNGKEDNKISGAEVVDFIKRNLGI